jgi:hypothetical protein
MTAEAGRAQKHGAPSYEAGSPRTTAEVSDANPLDG